MTLASVVVMTTHHITSLHIRSVPVLDQDEALDFWTTHLGFEVRDGRERGYVEGLGVAAVHLVAGPQHPPVGVLLRGEGRSHASEPSRGGGRDKDSGTAPGGSRAAVARWGPVPVV